MEEKPIFKFYVNENGISEVKEFLEAIPEKDATKLLSTIKKINEHGMLIVQRQEWVKKLDKEIFEIRSKVSTNIQRVLYFKEVDNQYIITHGFTKKTKKTPVGEINHAKQIRTRYFKKKEEEKNGNN